MIRTLTCTALLFSFASSARAAATIVFLLDQSGSMSSSCGPASCYTQMTSTLGATLGVYESQANIGAALFTGDGAASCPALSTVPPAPNNRPAITNLLNSSSPEGEKPLADAIYAAIPLFANTASPRALIAVFRGDPDTCAQPTPNAGFPQAIAAASNAFSYGIPVIVVSLDGSSPSSLQALANAGAGLPVGGPTNAPYYVAVLAPQMNIAFNTAVAGVLASPIPVFPIH